MEISEYSFDDRISWSWKTTKDIVETGKKNPDYRGIIVSGEEGESIIHAHYMAETWRNRFWTYNRAFQNAVEYRVESYVDVHLKKKNEYRHMCCLFSIENKGRKYVIQLDSFKQDLVWLAGDIISFC
jgi:hypothetical protein